MPRKRRRGFSRSQGGRELSIVRKAHQILRRNATQHNPGLGIPNEPVIVPNYCLLKGCDSVGHLDGVSQSHITLSACPKYHNTSFSYFKDLVNGSKKEDVKAKENDSSMPEKTFNGRQFIKFHEIELTDLASSADIELFRRAQQRLASDKKKEITDHILTLAKLHEMDKERKYASSTVLCSPQGGEVSERPLYTKNNIVDIIFGEYEIPTWYSSAYPPEIACLPRIYICEYCLSPMTHLIGYRRHRLRCKRKYPPGNEIYRKDKLSFFEVDGATQREYCHSLCLLAKLYLKQKTVYEVDRVPGFLFYILTQSDDSGCHVVGYFSKHKAEEQARPMSKYNNLSCLLVLPQFRRQGFGLMLIEFSYILSRLEGRLGTPERPLSEQGLLVYRRYWRWSLLSFLKPYTDKEITFDMISTETGMNTKDIISTLLDLGMLKYIRYKYFIVNDKEKIQEELEKVGDLRADRRIDTQCLFWLTDAAPVLLVEPETQTLD